MFRPKRSGRVAQMVAKIFVATALCFGLAILVQANAAAEEATDQIMTLNDLAPPSGSTASTPSPTPEEYAVPDTPTEPVASGGPVITTPPATAPATTAAPAVSSSYGATVVDPNIYYRWPDGSIQLTPPPGTPSVGTPSGVTTYSGDSYVATVPSTTEYYDPGLIVTETVPTYTGSVIVYDDDYPTYDNWGFGIGIGLGSGWWGGPYWDNRPYHGYRDWGRYHPRPPPPRHWDGGGRRPPPPPRIGGGGHPGRPPGSRPHGGPRIRSGGGGPSHGGSRPPGSGGGGSRGGRIRPPRR